MGSHEVIPAYDGSVTEAAETADPSLLKVATDMCEQRQRAWVKRKEVSGGQCSWRPSKRYRLGAKHWVAALDNSLVFSTPLGGLAHFRRPASPETQPERWRNWRYWPHLLLSTDQGSDALCGTTFLRSQGLCLSALMDWSHGGSNDFFVGLKDMGLMAFWILFMVPLTVEQGPFNDDMRFNQVREGWTEATKFMKHTDMPCFLEKTKAMLHEMGGDSELLQGSEETDLEQLLWMRMRDAYKLKGPKANLHRFFDTRAQAEKFLSFWSATLCKHEFVCIEQGMMSNKQLERIIVKDASVFDQQEGGPPIALAGVCLRKHFARAATIRW